MQIQLSGKVYLAETEAKPIIKFIKKRGDYSVSLSLKSLEENSLAEQGNNVFPPMPFIIGPIALYDFGSYYRFQILLKGDGKDYIEFEKTTKWVDIGFAYHHESTSFYLSINNTIVYQNKEGKVKDAQDFRIVLGKGYLDRYWIGKIKEFKILNEFISDPKQLKNTATNIHLEDALTEYYNYPIVKVLNGNFKNDFVYITKKGKKEKIRYYSSGETCQDKWVIAFLEGKKNGFFVDVGASNGISANNTLTLERYFDWNGILIEGNANSYKQLGLNRPKQICINAIVTDEEKEITWRDNNDMVTRSGIDDTLPPDNSNKSWRMGNKITLKGKTLEALFEENNCPKIIDFFAIDIEGGEVNALKNFPFSKYHINLMSAEVGVTNKMAFRKLMAENDFIEVENPYCSATYEHFFINKKLK